ncbi:MAG: hypothetical protein Rhims3KO_14820 [Hyphomicrobiales bacterium]
MKENEPDRPEASSQREQRRRAAAERAKAEADERRAKAEIAASAAPKEIDGRGGLDPVRYEDWEIKGLTSDF